ncbi:MAG: hypothetical protein ACRDWD_05105 [Acidimicrobiia bacterium]
MPAGVAIACVGLSRITDHVERSSSPLRPRTQRCRSRVQQLGAEHSDLGKCPNVAQPGGHPRSLGEGARGAGVIVMLKPLQSTTGVRQQALPDAIADPAFGASRARGSPNRCRKPAQITVRLE